MLAGVGMSDIRLGFRYWFFTPGNGILAGSALMAASVALRRLH